MSRCCKGLALLTVAVALNACQTELRIEPLAQVEVPVVVDEHVELARTYAPVIYHAVHETDGRQDLPTRVDFDGNLRGDDNWDNMPRYRLPPTVYYAVLETKTHWFIAYHLFHPRDYSYFRFGAHETHENDGENLQVVVHKASAKVVLLTTQAHYRGRSYAVPSAGFGDGDAVLHGAPLLFDDAGVLSAHGTHVGVFVQAYGHGIYSAGDADCAGVAVSADGGARFDGFGIVLRPAAAGVAVYEPDPRTDQPVAYQLESTTARLWPGVASGDLIGEGGLFDDVARFDGPLGPIAVPRAYEADRFSGPFGPDRGISPFAIDYGFWGGSAGALFFDPAGRYAEKLTIPTPWSREYVDYPFD